MNEIDVVHNQRWTSNAIDESGKNLVHIKFSAIKLPHHVVKNVKTTNRPKNRLENTISSDNYYSSGDLHSVEEKRKRSKLIPNNSVQRA